MIVDVHTHVWERRHLGEEFIHDARVTAGEAYKDIEVDLWAKFVLIVALSGATALLRSPHRVEPSDVMLSRLERLFGHSVAQLK